MKLFQILFTISYILIVGKSQAQDSKKQMDYSAIKSMCGCYNVEFNFAETFNYSNDSLYEASKVKNDKALEWVQVIEDSPSKISLQHILIIGDSANHYIVKHWRQDWLYENTQFMMFDYDNKWTYEENNRVGDHIWWISDVRKFKSHFPEWEYRYGIREILEEIVEAQMVRS